MVLIFFGSIHGDIQHVGVTIKLFTLAEVSLGLMEI